jgi:uncharacterized protein DUF6582
MAAKTHKDGAQSAKEAHERPETHQSASTRASRRTTALSTAEKDNMPAGTFAFPKERKEPIHDASHVRNAIARFDQVEGVSDAERDRAWKRILSAARRFDVEVSEASWRDLFKRHRG